MSQDVEYAREEDGKRILEIIESSSVKGKIELLYTRRPNAVVSYKKESTDTDIFTIKENNEIIGTVVNIVREAYINGIPKRLSYICGLKRDCNYTGNINWFKALKKYYRSDVDYYFCSIILDNDEIKKMLEKKRTRTVNTELLNKYRTYILSPYLSIKGKDKYTFKQATQNDEQDIINFLNEEGKQKELFPVIRSLNQFTDLSITDFYILYKGNEIMAVGALWNQTSYRQYIVKEYHRNIKICKNYKSSFKKIRVY